MPTFKMTVLLDVLGAGFSESFYGDYTNLAVAQINMDKYLPIRQGILSSGSPDVGPAKIVGYRMQQIDEPLNYTVKRVELEGTYKGDPPEGPDQPWTGVLFSLLSLSGRRRPFTLRGIDDSAIIGDYKSVKFTAGFQKAINAWLKSLKDAGFGIKTQDKGGGNPLHDIGSLALVNGLPEVTTAADHGLTSRDRIRWENVNSTPSLTGEHSIVVTTTKKFLVTGYNLGTINFIVGQYRKVVPALSGIVDGFAVRKAERKAGRPFYLLRGRR